MTWGYRVFMLPDSEDEGIFVIREVFYNKDGQIEFWSETNSFPQGATIDDLVIDLELYQDALDLPILRVEGDSLVEVELQEEDFLDDDGEDDLDDEFLPDDDDD